MKSWLNRLIHKITLQLIAYCEGRGKVFFITGKGTQDIYLIRYLLVNTRFFNFYIHRFLRSDHDVPHDHPWDFITYVVDGEYREEKYEDPTGFYLKSDTDFQKVYNYRGKGSLVFRKATDVHKVKVEESVPVLEKERAPLTICITGPRKRTWGFWEGDIILDGMSGTEQVNSKFIKWTDYLGVKDDSGKRG